MKMYFELLVIDPNGKSEIVSTKSMLHGLLSTEKMWSEPVEKKEGEYTCIQDGDVSLKILPIDTSRMLYDLIESAFIIKVKSENFDKLEKFRYPLIAHLKNRLRFEHIRVLTDDISTTISNRLYPMINELENLLRRYIAKFFTQKIGLDWYKKAVPNSVLEKTRLRGRNETIFSKMVETDIALIDFDDLGEIIYKHKLGFNKPENLVDKVMSIHNQDDLKKLKSDLDSNYNRFFKKHFKDHDFDVKWKTFFHLRNKVAHNNLFTEQDLKNAETLFDDLKTIILNAENSIDDFKFSVEEQEAMMQETTSGDVVDNGNSSKMPESSSIKVLGHVSLDDYEPYQDKKLVAITEELLIEELYAAQESLNYSRLTYVGLKSFVTKVLLPKGYACGPTYALINILRDKDVVEIYDIDDENSYYPVKAVRIL